MNISGALGTWLSIPVLLRDTLIWRGAKEPYLPAAPSWSVVALLSPERLAIHGLGYWEASLLVGRERWSQWPVIALAQCFQVGEAVYAHARLCRDGVIWLLTVRGVAWACYKICRQTGDTMRNTCRDNIQRWKRFEINDNNLYFQLQGVWIHPHYTNLWTSAPAAPLDCWAFHLAAQPASVWPPWVSAWSFWPWTSSLRRPGPKTG